MSSDEIIVPKELREFMPDNAKETVLGHSNGAIRQYRYGNLHIREYDDKFLVHADKADPRKDVLGHLVHDAPEILAGLACAALGAMYAAKHTKHNKVPSYIVSSIVGGYLGYAITRKAKNHLGKRDVES